MKLIKSAFALAAGAALLAGASAQAQIPLSVNLVGSFTAQNDFKPVINIGFTAPSLVAKTASTLAIKFPAGAKLAADTDGRLVIVDAANAVILNLSNGTNTDTVYTTNITRGVNGSSNTNITEVNRTVWVSYSRGGTSAYNNSDDQGFAFYDAQWSGTFTDTNTFKVTGKAIAGGSDDEPFWLNFLVTNYKHTQTRNGDFNNGTSYDACSLELFDGNKATVNSALSGGIYTISFSINTSGLIYLYNSAQGIYGQTGVLVGMISGAGKQTGGTSFLDPFNGNGNVGDDWYNF